VAIKGILGRKVGMTQLYLDSGEAIGVTAIEAGPCVVMQVKTAEKDGYPALRLGFAPVKEKSLNGPDLGQFKKRGLAPHRFVREVGWDGKDEVKSGDQVTVNVLEGVQFVDVVGRTKGRGFAGVVKRWSFAGGPATHGQSDRERAPGSLGRQGSNPGDVIKNKKMGGHYGDERITAKNLPLVRILKDENVILVHGSVPGPAGALVLVRPSTKVQKVRVVEAKGKKVEIQKKKK
jgi:large subunit ribosomal protein L3